MSSYHDSFSYKDINSFKDMDLIISSFEPDDGFMETFLSMDPVFEENFDGSKVFSYGARYNTQAKINITLVKKDGSDFSMQEFRKCAKWLTGARVDSWLDMFIGPSHDANGEPLKENIVYSFLGKVTDLQQYKLDGRTVGLQIVFSSVTPWAFSAVQECECSFGQKINLIDTILYNDKVYNDVLYVGSPLDSELTVGKYTDLDGTSIDGVLYAGTGDVCFSFAKEDYYDSVICIDNTVDVKINNLTDDLYTYINLDIKFTNENSEDLSIKNHYNTIDGIPVEEETKVLNMKKGEIVTLSSGQFITSEELTADLSVNKDTTGYYFVQDTTQLSGYRQVNLPKEYKEENANGEKILYYRYTPNIAKIFGDDFNFVWPRLAPGMNIFAISGGGSGNVQFIYRYPMKIGDCVMDTNIYGNGIGCDNCPSGGSSGEEFTGTISWDKVTDKPDTIQGYRIDDEVYTKNEVDIMLGDIITTDVFIDEDELNEMLKNALG